MTNVLSTLYLLIVSVSSSCAVVHMFCNASQDGGQLQSTYRLISDLGKSRQRKRISRKEPFKISKISKFGREIL